MNPRALSLEESVDFPETRDLIVRGGDARIEIVFGLNEYGCGPLPDPGLAQFGSSTASTISASGYAAADALRERILSAPEMLCSREFGRMREELSSLLGLAEGTSILFCPSGTDVHRIASGIAAPDRVVMAESAETGRGVPDALSNHAGAEISYVRMREENGSPRKACEIDGEVFEKVESCVKRGAKALLVLVDVSKTGMLFPSLSCALELKNRFPDALEILVDACQFRISPETLRAYLGNGFMVALTGSKFLTGPTFSGALLLPAGASPPSRFSGREPNFGLLLRWEAALAELRAFRRIPGSRVENFLREFSGAVSCRLDEDPNFEALPVPGIDRTPLQEESGWDCIQTIFPFRVRRNGRFVGLQESRRIHALMRQDLSRIAEGEAAAMRVTLGQPVCCSALRLCSSARLVVEGVEKPDGVIEHALLALDKVALLANLPG